QPGRSGADDHDLSSCHRSPRPVSAPGMWRERRPIEGVRGMDGATPNLYFSGMSAVRTPRNLFPGAKVPAFFLYGEPLQPPDERVVHVETIAARSRLHDWVIEPHRHRDLH